MAKLRLTGATFDASLKTVTHASFSDVTLAGIQLITNVTDQIIIYSFADTAKGGTLSTDTLTLEYDTTSMSDTDELMILVEDGATTQPVSGTVTAELSATDNAVLDDIALDTEAIKDSLETVGGQVVNLGANNDVTVTGTVDLGATDNAVLDAIEVDTTTIAGAVSGTEMQVDVITMPSVAVTNAGLTELAAAINVSSQMDVNLAASGITLPVSGAFYQATQPVSGTFY